MKFLGLLLTSFLIFSCAVEHGRTIDPKTILKTKGGVDVGNMSSTVGIPGTHASITLPGTWKHNLDSGTLNLTNAGSSTIQVAQMELKKLTIPTQLGLLAYLKVKFPDREYKMIEINGLKGVRAEIIGTDEQKKSDLYLISELKEIIHLTSNLWRSLDGFIEGEKILSTVRVKYKGEPIKNSKAKEQVISTDTSYSLLGECQYEHKRDPNCHGIALSYSPWGFEVESEEGRIVDLGSEEEIPFDSIQVEGEYLIAPQTKISIADIYTTFTPKNQNQEQRSVKPKAGHVYLIRTVDWPNEDLIVKVKIESLDDKKYSLKLKYQKLIFVRPEILKQQVEIINKNTIKSKVPLEDGEVTLFNSAIWKNQSYASFNFKFSSSGNKYITNNSWDLKFDNRCNKKRASLNVPVDHLGRIVLIENKSLSLVTKSDFPSSTILPENFECEHSFEIGKTYGVYVHKSGKNQGSTYGAFEVLEIGANDSWIRLKFRRISIDKPERFQKWSEEPDISTKIKSRSHTLGYNYSTDWDQFYFSHQPKVEINMIEKECAYEKECGVINFGKDVDMNSLTIEDFEIKKGSYQSKIEIAPGDVIGVFGESYVLKKYTVIKIEKISQGESVEFKIKDLYFNASVFEGIGNLLATKLGNFFAGLMIL